MLSSMVEVSSFPDQVVGDDVPDWLVEAFAPESWQAVRSAAPDKIQGMEDRPRTRIPYQWRLGAAMRSGFARLWAVQGLRCTERRLTLDRQAWFVHRRTPAPVISARPAESALALEELARVMWMVLGGSVILFVASLPGGAPAVMTVLGGVALGSVGLFGLRRVRDGPTPQPPRLDRARDVRHHLAQSRA